MRLKPTQDNLDKLQTLLASFAKVADLSVKVLSAPIYDVATQTSVLEAELEQVGKLLFNIKLDYHEVEQPTESENNG